MAFYRPETAFYLKIQDKKKEMLYTIAIPTGKSEVVIVKVKIEVSTAVTEPYAVIHTDRITEEISQAAALLESGIPKDVITVMDSERIIVLHLDEIYMVRVENEKTIVYTKKEKYHSSKRLYELETLLGNGFMRISKSVLVNLDYLGCVEPSFGGVMLLVLKNGCKDYISRKYLPAFKKYLGI